ncbi:hypothetical protein [Rhodococcus sp. IEGM 1379]|uniref:hypothetical protein n=1 Tax=Rhodococcus sp. IEGM 1379 TaxID=3047086 RepID=UPI0024B7C743|nr:hypothetical protein [Rhodococcus sp. IEGM 1379]MDI9915450.1 hypothetical protein [Rhodococcus sp. IEGM 1379]
MVLELGEAQKLVSCAGQRDQRCNDGGVVVMGFSLALAGTVAAGVPVAAEIERPGFSTSGDGREWDRSRCLLRCCSHAGEVRGQQISLS